MDVLSRPSADGTTLFFESYMATSPDTYRVPQTVPSRPSKLIMVILAGVVVAFFAVFLTHKDEAPAGSGSAAPATTQE